MFIGAPAPHCSLPGSARALIFTTMPPWRSPPFCLARELSSPHWFSGHHRCKKQAGDVRDLSCPFEEVGIVIAGRALWLVVGCFLPLECAPAGRTKNPDRCMRSGTLLIAALLIFSLPEGSRGAEVIPLMDRCLTLSLFSCWRGQGGSGGIRHLP